VEKKFGVKKVDGARYFWVTSLELENTQVIDCFFCCKWNYV